MHTITINLDGIERVFQASYDELHNVDWNEKVRNLLDS